MLGICYGSQLMAHLLGGKVATAPVSEYGKTEVNVDNGKRLFEGVSSKTICWMSHTDYIEKAPEGFTVTAHTPVCPVAGMENVKKGLYAVQFHPEVMHTQEGMKMLRNFVMIYFRLAIFAHRRCSNLAPEKMRHQLRAIAYPQCRTVSPGGNAYAGRDEDAA